jgi:predicted nucleotidyltransferase
MIREGVKLPKDVEYKIPGLTQSAARDRDIIALYAFGSLAQHALKPLSDLDFGILLASRLDKQERFDKDIELIGLFTDFLKTDEIDLIVMNDAPPRIAFNILKTGKLLLCNDRSTLVDFREHIVKYYLDFKYFRDQFDAIFLKGVGYYG